MPQILYFIMLNILRSVGGIACAHDADLLFTLVQANNMLSRTDFSDGQRQCGLKMCPPCKADFTLATTKARGGLVAASSDIWAGGRRDVQLAVGLELSVVIALVIYYFISLHYLIFASCFGCYFILHYVYASFAFHSLEIGRQANPQKLNCIVVVGEVSIKVVFLPI